MRNIKLTISYDGTKYKGWQVQKNGRTVQEELERSVKKVFGRKQCVHGAGRTDAGVHAKAQTAHFKATTAIPTEKIPQALNAALPEDIAVIRAEEAPAGFHARFDAVAKHYRYHILVSRHRDPFTEKYSWRVPYRLDIGLMRKEAASLVGRHDFRSFQASDKRERSSVRKIASVAVSRKKDRMVVDIEGDGFLYNMVRNIVGTLVDIGRGHLPPGSMRRIMDSRDRTKAGPTAPAKGLFLVEVKY